MLIRRAPDRTALEPRVAGASLLRPMLAPRRTAVVALLVALLGCGGGGGGETIASLEPMAPSIPEPVGDGPFGLVFTGLAVPHAGQLLHVVVIKERDGSVAARNVQTVAADGSFRFSWDAILEANQLYYLDFYADYNLNGRCDLPPIDHSWRESVEIPQGPVVHDFQHHANFTDVCGSF